MGDSLICAILLIPRQIENDAGRSLFLPSFLCAQRASFFWRVHFSEKRADSSADGDCETSFLGSGLGALLPVTSTLA